MVKNGGPASLVTVTAVEADGTSIVEQAAPMVDEVKGVFATIALLFYSMKRLRGIPPSPTGCHRLFQVVQLFARKVVLVCSERNRPSNAAQNRGKR